MKEKNIKPTYRLSFARYSPDDCHSARWYADKINDTLRYFGEDSHVDYCEYNRYEPWDDPDWRNYEVWWDNKLMLRCTAYKPDERPWVEQMIADYLLGMYSMIFNLEREG